MKFRFLPLAVVVLFILTACQSTWNIYTRVYVQNTTADSFRVFIAYPPTDTTVFFKIKPDQTRLLSSYYQDDESGFGISRNTDIWLFNYNDTTWTLLSNHHTNAEYTDRYRQYISTDNLQVKALNPNYNDRILTLTINDNLLQEMVQDTLLTDSIFGVR
jgi:lipopolysaccharide export LptBFGC system permease protein LptF